MVNKNIALITSGTIFALIAIVHIIRLIMRLQLIAAGADAPVSWSIARVLITGSLAIWMFAAAKQK